MTGRTLVDKIWDEHVIAQVDEGLDLLHVDRHLVHDVTSPRAFTTLRDRGIGVLSPHTTVVPGRVRPSSGPITWTMPWSGESMSNSVRPCVAKL